MARPIGSSRSREKLLEDRDSEVRYEAFEALVRTGRVEQALMWLEEAPEAEARLALMRWSARGRAKQCAETLVHASRRLRRLLVESVRLAKWQDLAPAIGDDITLVRAIARRNPGVFEEMPPAALIRATLREPTAAWLTMIRDRLIALDHPTDDLAGGAAASSAISARSKSPNATRRSVGCVSNATKISSAASTTSRTSAS